MSTLTVWKFDDPAGAQQAEEKLVALSKEHLITVLDAAIVTWEEGKKKPKTRQANNLAAAGALGGAFWGWLFGLLFLVPLLGMAIGAAAGALGGSMAVVGIDDDFIDSVKSQVVPGTSALFLMTQDAVIDRVSDAFDGTNAQLVKTNLSKDQEEALRSAFADED